MYEGEELRKCGKSWEVHGEHGPAFTHLHLTTSRNHPTARSFRGHHRLVPDAGDDLSKHTVSNPETPDCFPLPISLKNATL